MEKKIFTIKRNGRKKVIQLKKVVLVPDSFKGTLTSVQICDIMARAVRRFYPDAQILSVPVADGGEGSVDAFLQAVGGKKRTCPVQGPYGEQTNSFYGLLPDGTAVVEMAAAAGLPMVGSTRNAERTTTYGVGQLMAAALDAGCKKLVVGLGGSATNDGGCGAAAALGAVFLDKSGTSFVPVGRTLEQIEHIDLSGLHPRLKQVPVIAMCDVDTPLCGPTGAAAVFGPQKGADEAMVARLDAGLRHFGDVVLRDTGKEILDLPGAGAAGGMGGGMAALLGAQMQMGIETVLDTVGFETMLQGADLVFTGEGKLDAQSLRGKVVLGVARRAKKAGVPVAAVVGDIGDHIEEVYDQGVTGVFSINRVALPYEAMKPRAADDLRLTVENLLRFYRDGRKTGLA